MGIHDVTTPYLGMLSLPLASLGMLALPLPYMGIGSRDIVLKDFTNVSTPLRAARAARAARVEPRTKSGENLVERVIEVRVKKYLTTEPLTFTIKPR